MDEVVQSPVGQERTAASADGALRQRSLIEWEQHVNERLGTDPAPRVSADLLPETGGWLPMRWVRAERSALTELHDHAEDQVALPRMANTVPGEVLFPIHPLIEGAFPADRIVTAGRFAVSASYRTVFYEPGPGDPFYGVARQDQTLMLKLHLDEVLPGIAGDRRLTPAKVAKCVALSRELPRALAASSRPHRLEVMRERTGLLLGNRGALLRVVPRAGALPLFSFYSRDARQPDSPPVLIERLDALAGGPAAAAMRYGELLAEPLAAGVLAGFQQGFSLELHAQNAVAIPGSDRLIERVLFRDLESVVFFPELRRRLGFAPAPLDTSDPELIQEPRDPVRWFNRNMDHDVGRILRWSLNILEREGYFGPRESRRAAASIRRTVRGLISDFGLGFLARQGRWLPYSRSPYGNGRRPGHYYRTWFR
jgi:hypothetical protein